MSLIIIIIIIIITLDQTLSMKNCVKYNVHMYTVNTHKCRSIPTTVFVLCHSGMVPVVNYEKSLYDG